MINVDKNYLLTESKTFCLIPWTHIHTTPSGKALPCCISKLDWEGVGNTRNSSLVEIVNSQKMKELRSNMINGIASPECVQCYDHEKEGIKSFRQSYTEDYSAAFDESMALTNEDYSLQEFKMRHFDIRFSNICNFKCRTCGSEFSSQWETEDKKRIGKFAKTIPKNDRPELLQEVLNQIENIKVAYFAGGEPLITEEHYIILEEMIRQNKTNIKLRYNTNLSNFKFKDKDLLGLWKCFTNGVEIYASIDHYGERAEYIRHGTDWSTVESNLKLAKNIPYIHTQLNTVVSLYNYVTFDDFYQYLVNNNLYNPNDLTYSIYNMHGPLELATHVLPIHHKLVGEKNMLNLINFMIKRGFRHDVIKQLYSTIQWTKSKDAWEVEKENFKKFTGEIDNVRGESFVKTFPELADLMD